jgi:multidrug efflux pump subunit AcrB
MNFYERLIRNHPLANIAFAVVLAMGVLAYLTMPREQDPEINFNWCCRALPPRTWKSA